MSFVCWDAARLPRVLDTEALQIPDAEFLATHVRRKLCQVDPKSPQIFRSEMEPERLLQQFLAPGVPHMQTVVIGTSGAGKSRLIRWLAIHIPETPQRRVVLLQKAGMNLRGALEEILRGLEGQEFDLYRERLRQAVAVADPRVAPEELLNQIQQSVSPNSAYAGEKSDDNDVQEMREILMEDLPALLGDPAFRRELRIRVRVVDDLARHAVGRDDDGRRERRDAPRDFEEADFEIGRWDITENDVNRLARRMFQKLRSSESWRRAATVWVNRNLNDALGRLLSFSRDDLGQMLLEVRRTLARQGKELVLLIEDFARLQGVDYALLDAISVRPENYPGGPLCRLRSIMAMTTSYYERISQTFSSRMDLAVDVDPKDGVADGDAALDPDLERIAAYHLNAVRLSEGDLSQWSEGAREAARTGGASLPMLPSRCTPCPHREECHKAFGKIEPTDGEAIGLYPFTKRSLREMYRRTEESGPFNPRRLLGSVLRQPLINYTGDLERGQWPPLALLNDFGRRKMPPAAVRQIEIAKGPDAAGRYIALFELYGDPVELKNVGTGIYRMFQLPTFSPSGTGDEPGTEPDNGLAPEKETPTAARLPAAVQNLMDALDKWSNGAALQQEQLKELRPRLFQQIKARIDWNALFLGDTVHSGASSRVLGPTSVNFEGQSVNLGTVAVTLTIGRKSVLGVQAAVLFEHHGNWNFKDSETYLPEFADLIETLADEAAQKIRNHNGKKSVDPAPALAELLALDALFHGAITDRDEEALLRAVLSDEAPAGAAADALTNKSKQLAASLRLERPRLRTLLMGQIACAKGPTTESATLIDAARIRPALQKIARTWRPTAALPTEILRDYQPALDLRKKVDERLNPALTEEVTALQNQLTAINELIGEGVSSQKTREAVRQASQAARDAGVWWAQGYTQETFAAAIENVRVGKLDDLRIKASKETLNEARNAPALFQAEQRGDAQRGAAFVAAANAFLTAAAGETERRIAPLVASGEDADAVKDMLKSMDSLLTALRCLPSPSAEDSGTAQNGNTKGEQAE